ncbi:MAG: signal peptidase I [Phycisphaerae bacterium]|nr:signal peptidase I [Phycisphaerae bacterium]
MSEAAATKSDHLGQVRDSVESVYVAIVLAFVLRAFMIEAFVIPTGSMANALYGDHYELTCPSCGWQYAYGRDSHNTPGMARCPNCHFRYGDAPHRGKPVEPKGGDRVLVLKYLYDFSPLQPWDVVVFKNPQNNRENYIKRLIGLPGEGIQIVQGDIFVSKDKGKTWRIRRKPNSAQQDMWQIVHDADYPPTPALTAVSSADPPRWISTQADVKAGVSRWNLKEYGGRVFSYTGGDEVETIRFEPGYAAYRPFNGYNDSENRQLGYDPETDICTDWKLSCVWRVKSDAPAVMDMTFSSYGDRYRAEFDSRGTVRLLHQRRDAPEDAWEEWGRVDVEPFTPAQGRRVALTNVDYRAAVWVGDARVLESTDEQYAAPSDEGGAAAERIYRKAMDRATLRQRLLKCESDIQKGMLELDRQVVRSSRRKQFLDALEQEKARRESLRQAETWFETPEIRVSARGGPSALWHVKVQRDVYYTQSRLPDPRNYSPKDPNRDPDSPVYDYFRRLAKNIEEGKDFTSGLKAHPGGAFVSWGAMGHPMFLKDYPGKSDLDEFFCLGDNSSQSHDGRSWEAAAPSIRLYDDDGKPIYQLGTVPRYNLLGRAMLVYWPAGFRLPILDWPIVPNVGRIRLIR